MKVVDLNLYKEFVEQVTSSESNSITALNERMKELEECGVNPALLLTASTGMASEGGEFSEIVKKCTFQRKPMNPDTIFHMKRELGDIIWYWVNECRALNLNPNEVIEENVHKLESRYPGGSFDVHYSENRQDGDL